MPSRLLAAAVFLWLPLPAWGQHVTVDLAQAPLKEALAELERQSGARIYSKLGGAAGQLPVDLQIEDAPVRAALRAICRQLGCHFGQSTRGSFWLADGPSPAEQCPTVRAGPYTVRVRSIAITDALNLSFVLGDENPLTFQDRTSVKLSMEADEDMDLEAVIGVDRNLMATDDAGRIVAPRETGLPEEYYDQHGSWYAAADGTVSDSVPLDVPHPEATSLRSLEGDIVVHDWCQEASLEIPLEGPHEPQSTGGHSFVINNVEPEDEDGYCKVETEWRFPWSPRREPRNEPYLVAADGTRQHFTSASGTMPREGDDLIYKRTYRFSLPNGFVPRKFLFEFVAKSRETHRVHFKFEDIPLPTREE